VTAATATASIAGQGNIIVQASGSARVSINAQVSLNHVPHLVLTDFEARTQLIRGDASDAALLSSYRADVVPLLGRAEALANLQGWLDASRRVSVCVMVGGAGRGKTRLAVELVRKASGSGWLAGFVTNKELNRFRGQQNVAHWGWDKPTLVVIDYAASRADQLHDWLDELVDTRTTGRPRLRILLLERQAQREIGWLATVIGHGQDDASRAVRTLLDPAEPVALPVLEDPAIRRQIFGAVVGRTQTDLTPPALGVDSEFDRQLRDEKWSGDPLFLMMAGLVAGERGFSNVLTLSRADLAATIAHRELDRVGHIAANAGIDSTYRGHPGFLLRHIAVMATLRQGLLIGEARQFIEDEARAIGRTADVSASLEALRDALPGWFEEREISPIQPDIVGEAAILIWLGQRGVLAKQGIESLNCVQRVSDTALSRVTQTLVRTAQDFAAAGHDEPVRWLNSLSQAIDTDLGALVEIADQLPRQTLALRELAADLQKRIADQLRAALGMDVALAGALTNLGVRFFDLGRLEEALAASQESIEILRRFAQSRPDALVPSFAASLGNLGMILTALGQSEEAVAASREAVDIYRRLVQIRPDAFFPDLALSLGNLSFRLSRLGRREEALAASQEAVDIQRRLSQSRPDVFLPDLAGGLTNLGKSFSDLGRREEALTTSQEAADIYRRLAQSHPDAYLPDLAMILNNISADFSDFGRREEALTASQEAADIYRRLVQRHPDAFLPHLARSLRCLGPMLCNLGQRDEALVVSQEAVDIYRHLAQSRPDAFLSDLANSLNTLGAMQFNLGRCELALAAGQEAVNIYRPLAQSHPDAFLSELARSLNNISGYFSNFERDEAVAASREAVDIYRRLVQSYPDAFLSELAVSLANLGGRLSDLGRLEEALAASQESVEILRPLAQSQPDVFLPDLARSRNNLARLRMKVVASGAIMRLHSVWARIVKRWLRPRL
jgi:tetratricopeptide (TPR) repeat protein